MESTETNTSFQVYSIPKHEETHKAFHPLHAPTMSTEPTPTPNNPQPLRIAILTEHCQLLDFACIDLLGNCSTSYVSVCTAEGYLPPSLLPHSRPMQFFYPASTLDPALCTPEMHTQPTHTYETCPRDLDIILVGGPPLSHRPEGARRFLEEAVPRARVAVMSTCIGGLWLASSGVLEGRRATTNRGALGVARGLFEKTEWVDRRWVVDGKFWTAGGAAAGEFFLAFAFVLFAWD